MGLTVNKKWFLVCDMENKTSSGLEINYAVEVLGDIVSPTYKTREECCTWLEGKTFGGWRALITPVFGKQGK